MTELCRKNIFYHKYRLTGPYCIPRGVADGNGSSTSRTFFSLIAATHWGRTIDLILMLRRLSELSV